MNVKPLQFHNIVVMSLYTVSMGLKHRNPIWDLTGYGHWKMG